MSPLVSICVTTYNHSQYIAECLDSILRQKVSFEYEIVIGEDCSSDDTLVQCESYALKYSNIVLLKGEHNIGLKENYKRTVHNCRGKYIAFLDGDDYWTDEYKLQKQVDILENDPSVGLCFTFSSRVDMFSSNESRYPGEAFTLSLEQFIRRNPAENCTTMAPLDIIIQYYREVQPEKQNWKTEDLPMWIWVAAHYHTYCIHEITAVHRIVRESASHPVSYKKTLEFCDSLIDIELWADSKYNDNRLHSWLLRKRMNDALWLLSKKGTYSEFFHRWYKEFVSYPLMFNIIPCGLLLKRIIKGTKQ